MRISIFKTPKPKRFEYIPRYYDAEKELRDERNRRILRELENEKQSQTEEYKPMTKGDMRRYISTSHRRSSRRISAGGFLIKLFTIILALTVALLIFYGTFVLVKLA